MKQVFQRITHAKLIRLNLAVVFVIVIEVSLSSCEKIFKNNRTDKETVENPDKANGDNKRPGGNDSSTDGTQSNDASPNTTGNTGNDSGSVNGGDKLDFPILAPIATKKHVYEIRSDAVLGAGLSEAPHPLTQYATISLNLNRGRCAYIIKFKLSFS